MPIVEHSRMRSVGKVAVSDTFGLITSLIFCKTDYNTVTFN